MNLALTRNEKKQPVFFRGRVPLIRNTGRFAEQFRQP